MSALFSSPPKQPPLPPAPKGVEQTVENAANAEKIRLMRAMGRQSTILTDTGMAGRKTLLGG